MFQGMDSLKLLSLAEMPGIAIADHAFNATQKLTHLYVLLVIVLIVAHIRVQGPEQHRSFSPTGLKDDGLNSSSRTVSAPTTFCVIT